MENIINVQYLLVYKYKQKKLLIKSFKKTKEIRQTIKKFIENKDILPIVYYERVDIITNEDLNILEIFLNKSIELEEEELEIITEGDYIDFFSFIKNIYIYDNVQEQDELGLSIQEHFIDIIERQFKKYEKEKNFYSMKYD